MSRRPQPGADRAAQNAQTLKALVKLEGNKVCADCKRNKHPRWASWNIGVFVCIRCSGIHRGMGTHISRVKSVDLDAWTDEQLQSMLKWGNTRANKYWEAKLAPGHVPSEAKIENFIRTKYDTKRWVMDGPMPDPTTLDTDDDVPLNIVQEKAKIERSGSLRSAQAPAQALQPPKAAPAQNVNLFDDFIAEPPVRPSTADIGVAKASIPAPAAAKPKQESLLGLDFFGTSQGAGIGRPASATSNSTTSTNARGDLKNTILSLYAPKSQATSQSMAQPSQGRQPSFGGMNSAPPQQQDSFSVLTDAFKDFRYSENKAKSPTIQQPASSSAFSGLNFNSPTSSKTTPAAPQVTSPAPLSGGSFFDSSYSKPATSKPAVPSNPSGGLNFSFTQNTTSTPVTKPQTISVPKDLFGDDGFADFATAPAPAAAAPPPLPPQVKSPPAPAPSMSDFGSAFNLSSAPPVPKAEPPKSFQPMASTQASSAMFDPWGANDSSGWGAPEPAKAAAAAPKVQLGSVPSHLTPNDISGGWGAPISSGNKSNTQPTVAADEDFGGWASASPQASRTSVSKPSGGFGGTSDPFDNPWG